MLKIQAFRVQREDKDKVVWTTSRSGDFSVKSLYSILEPRGSALFPYDSIWRAYVPHKVAFFAWEASRGEGTLWKIGVFFAFLKQKRWITFYFIVLRRGHCGIFFFLSLVWLGFSLVQLRKLSLDDMERLWGKPVKRRGKWPPYVYFGQFGRKEICWLLGMRCFHSKG